MLPFPVFLASMSSWRNVTGTLFDDMQVVLERGELYQVFQRHTLQWGATTLAGG